MDIVNRLSSFSVSGELINHYDDKLIANRIRRQNLCRYLQQMKTLDPTILLVGEAPGYRGCRLTGVPFTSESILLDDVEGKQLFGRSSGYQKTDEYPKISRESTATIVWQTLVALQVKPLLWNALPFHPYRAGRPWSNRTPSRKELQLGEPFLYDILGMFSIQTIVAVGKKAASMLGQWGFEPYRVRHPSHGGKKDFVRGIRAVIHKQSHLHHHLNYECLPR